MIWNIFWEIPKNKNMNILGQMPISKVLNRVYNIKAKANWFLLYFVHKDSRILGFLKCFYVNYLLLVCKDLADLRLDLGRLFNKMFINRSWFLSFFSSQALTVTNLALPMSKVFTVQWALWCTDVKYFIKISFVCLFNVTWKKIDPFVSCDNWFTLDLRLNLFLLFWYCLC